MEKYRYLPWYVALLIIVIAWYMHGASEERKHTVKVFGEYSFAPGKVSLNLKTNRGYDLTKNVHDHLSDGKFDVRKDTIILTDRKTKRKMYLLYGSEDKLIALKVDSVHSQTELLCWLKLYQDGKVKFNGGWKDGKKDGVWQYFAPEGYRTHMTLYKNGKVEKENFQFD